MPGLREQMKLHRQKIHSNLKKFIELLRSKKVEFVLVGGHAVAIHGYPRFTGDTDFLYRPTMSNARKLRHVLDEFGYSALDLTVEELIESGRITQLGVPPQRIDLLTSISGVGFDEVWESREQHDFGPMRIPVISKEHLLRNKRAAGRTKDLLDVEMLE